MTTKPWILAVCLASSAACKTTDQLAREALQGTWTGTGNTSSAVEPLEISVTSVTRIDATPVGAFDWQDVENGWQLRGTATYRGCNPDGRQTPFVGIYGMDFIGDQPLVIMKLEGCSGALDVLSGTVDDGLMQGIAHDSGWTPLANSCHHYRGQPFEPGYDVRAFCEKGAGWSVQRKSAQADGGVDASTAYGHDARACGSPRSQVIDKLDLLLVVDNSESMAGEQQSLKRALPKLIRVLTTGYRSPDDPAPFPPIKDLHVGVVSTDMGIPGVDLPPACNAEGGDDGKLQNVGHGSACGAQYPQWLTFNGDASSGMANDSSLFADDVGCIAALGTGGCGFEQQLEAPLKALMPRLLKDDAGNVQQSPYRFIATDEMRTWGRGDVPVAHGGNSGFLRDSSAGRSLLAIVVLSDEDDCSVRYTDHLKPDNQLPEDSSYRGEDMNLRCFYHKEFLYDLQQRYLLGFRALRPGHEDLVVFAAVVGVPPDLVDAAALARVRLSDKSERQQFFQAILDDSRMQEVVDPDSLPGSGQGKLRPSCTRTVAGEAGPVTAYPPRRIVELAQLFGANGIVQSICQDDFEPAIDRIVDTIAVPLRAAERCSTR